jgi:hypothetical protein
MNKNNQLIVQECEDNIYSIYLRRTIKTNEGLQGDEVAGFNLELGKSYQINNNSAIYLLGNRQCLGLIELCFLEKRSKETRK